MNQFQLPCENCGQVIPIALTMAGRGVTCPHCSHSMTAPKLGAIRALPPVVATTKQARNELRWSSESGIIFSTGFILLVIGAIGWGLSYNSYRVPAAEIARISADFPDGKLPDFSDLGRFEKVSSTIPVGQLWQDWREGLRANLNEWKPFKARVLLDKLDELQQYLTVFAIVTGVGLLLMISSFFFRRRSPVQAR
jgi:hypothetical protein